MFPSSTVILEGVRQTCFFCLRAFAPVMPFAREALPPNITMADFLSLSKPLLNVTLSLEESFLNTSFKMVPPPFSSPLFYFILLHSTSYNLTYFIYTFKNFFAGCSPSPLCKPHEIRDLILFTFQIILTKATQ